MSAFECNITPTRIKSVRKINESREPTLVVLGPFTPKAIVTFEDIPISKTARRLLQIQNPADIDLEIKVTKSPKKELNLSVEWTEKVVPAASEVSMELVWIPKNLECCRENLQLLDQYGNKKDISVILKSVELKKTTKRPVNVFHQVPKKLKMKNPSPPRNLIARRSIVTKKTSIVHTVQIEKMRSPLGEKNGNFNIDSINFSTIDATFEARSEIQSENQENVSPNTPVNASALFDNLKFTPATETKSKSTSKLEYLASLPTPQDAKREDFVQICNTTRRNLICNGISPDQPRFSLSKQQTPIVFSGIPNHSILSRLDTPLSTKQIRENNWVMAGQNGNTETPKSGSDQFVPSNCSTLSKMKKNPTNFEVLDKKELNMDSTGSPATAETYISPDPEISCNEIDLIFPEDPIPDVPDHHQVLEVISEEDFKEPQKDTTNFQKTFNIDKKSLSEDDLAVDKGDDSSLCRRVLSESMREFGQQLEIDKLKNNQGSLPNLNEVVESISSNRYYLQAPSQAEPNLSMESIVSTSEFYEKEINAQSSRFNINEIGLQTETKSAMENVNFESPKNQAKKLADSPILASSPTIRRVIRSDATFKSPWKKGAVMTFSPPKIKRICNDVVETFERESMAAPKGQVIRINTWKQPRAQQSKFQTARTVAPPRPSISLTNLANCSTTSINSTSSLPITPRKKYREDHVVMYNPECHLIGDPFAATTTQDPFLSSSMYLDEKSVDRIERQFKKWLNALVTIPAELESDENQKIDIGKLFQEVQKQELKLAPTREFVSSKYYRTRIDSLRSQAINFYKSEIIIVPMQKVARQIEDQGMSIRSDKNIQLDLVLQRHILELLLCFNPLWLRIGLEVVFGVQLDLNSNHDIVGLSRFIVQRMFKDPYLEQKYGKNFKKNEEFQKQMKKHQLKKFLFVLFFLDRAKENRLIKHNPCLYVRNAPYRESNEILKKFASLCLANFGDIVKHLKRFGFVLTHKQTYIDEFHYAFSNLAVDLRDGVRLTKVMEVILLREDLTKKLRAPAISRLQKIYNVELALTALREADYTILGDITAKDIADGHREKTLSLLWQIIYKFRAPRFNAAAITIQKWWRGLWLRVYIERQICIKREMRMNRAATVIQKSFRGFLTRKRTREFIEQRKAATLVIQKYTRGFLARKEARLRTQNILKIQKWFRNTRKTRKVRENFLKQKGAIKKLQNWWRMQELARKLMASATVIQEIKEESRKRHENALIIQKTFKSFMIRKKFRNLIQQVVVIQKTEKKEFICARKIQSFWRMRVIRNEFLLTKQITIKVQKIWRQKLLARKVRKEFLELRENTVKIQRYFRSLLVMRKERVEYQETRRVIINMQQKYRAKLLGRQEKLKFQQQKKAIIQFQRRFRGKLLMEQEKSQYLLLKKSTIVIQERFRAWMQMKQERLKFLELKSNVLFVQQKFRANKIREEFLVLKESTIKVQRIFRGKLKMREEQKKFEETKKAILKIQQRFRAQVLMKQERSKYLMICSATVKIQRRFRATKEMKKERGEFLELKRVTILLQQKFRATKLMKLEFMNYCTLQYYTAVVQQQFRAIKAMREAKKNYQQLREATMNIQRIFRGKQERKKFLELKKVVICVQERRIAILEMRSKRKEFLELKKAVLNVQSRFRAQRAMRVQRNEFLIQKSAAISMQKQFRMKMLREKFLALKTVTIEIQRKWRATLAMKQEREKFQELKKYTKIIQSRFRANIQMKQEKEEFTSKKEATIKIQQYFRGFRETRELRREFLVIRKSTILIQRKFRATMLRNQEREEFLKKKLAAGKIQEVFRGYLMMKQERQGFLQQKRSAILIQRKFRGFLETRKKRSEFLEQKSACLKIQVIWRATLLMRKERIQYLLLRNATIFIQQKFRATLRMNEEREDFLEMKRAAISIQTRFHAWKQMKIERKKFLELKESTILIQEKFRALLAMRKARTSYLELREATIILQTYYRARLMKIGQRQKFLDMKEACLVIQRKFRAWKLMKQERKEFLDKKKAVCVIESRYVAQKLMLEQRSRFLVLRTTVLLVQQRFRSNQDVKKYRKSFVNLRNVTVGLQARIRGYLARRRFEHLKSPEMVELRRQNRAARVLQAFWRGYYARKKNQTRNLREIAQRLMKANKNTDSSQTLQSRLHMSIKFLRGKYNVCEAFTVLTRMEYISRITPHLLIPHASFVAGFCYGIMGHAIRSEIDKQVIELCSCIILNLGRYKYTRADAFQESGLSTVAQMLLRWCDKDCGIFNTLCTFIFVFANYEHHKRKIRQFMTNQEAIYILRQIRLLVARKEKMRQNSKRPIGFFSISLQANKKESKELMLQQQIKYGLQNLKETPALDPDYGVIKKKPYIFYSSVFAFESVLDKLEINI